ncbi:MAG: efflux RND transporter periplasmic adaptor subunit, partial [Flavobacteriales bacterium]|nr:efflux RND transporter periplasmic adaptor subunit [Flavobacteriales bacterium]
VYAQVVQNGKVAIEMTATGKLTAKNRVELYAEVQGIMTSSSGNFKAGERYAKGSRLVSIDSEVYRAGLMAQKSNLQNMVTAALADIRLDFPQSFERWNAFLSALNVKNALPALPEPASEKEKLFITGRNIYTNYYNVRNMELTLAKYNLSAPFDGILIEALVTPGTLIRPGQKLGTLIQTSVYEMEMPVSTSMIEYLKVGQSVQLHATNKANSAWTGKVTRINALVNSSTQTINVYIEVSGAGLEEGMFLEANVAATEIDNAFEIDRSVLFNENQVYVALDSLLIQKTVEAKYFKERTVVVTGLSNNDLVLTKMPPRSFPGMRIVVLEN